MPNHVTNSVTIRGAEIDLDRLEKFVEGETAFDFNTIIPMPKPLREVCSGSCSIGGETCRAWRERQVNGETVKEAIPSTELASWVETYGADNWYDWAVRNWGTKWNAYDVMHARTSKNALTYEFTTAWDTALPVMKALSKAFPRVRIHVSLSGEIDEPYSYTVTSGALIPCQ